MKFITVFFLVISFSLQARVTLNIKVIDAHSSNPLPFIGMNFGEIGATSNSEGEMKVTINSYSEISQNIEVFCSTYTFPDQPLVYFLKSIDGDKISFVITGEKTYSQSYHIDVPIAKSHRWKEKEIPYNFYYDGQYRKKSLDVNVLEEGYFEFEDTVLDIKPKTWYKTRFYKEEYCENIEEAAIAFKEYIKQVGFYENRIYEMQFEHEEEIEDLEFTIDSLRAVIRGEEVEKIPYPEPIPELFAEIFTFVNQTSSIIDEIVRLQQEASKVLGNLKLKKCGVIVFIVHVNNYGKASFESQYISPGKEEAYEVIKKQFSRIYSPTEARGRPIKDSFQLCFEFTTAE